MPSQASETNPGGPRKFMFNGRLVEQEAFTMPQWAGSCWYYMRFTDPHNHKAFAAPSLLKRWLPVDLYVGGAEHAVLHLLYARFWHKVLQDAGLTEAPEPFQKLLNPGILLGPEIKLFIPLMVDDNSPATGNISIDHRALQKMAASASPKNSSDGLPARSDVVIGTDIATGRGIVAKPIEHKEGVFCKGNEWWYLPQEWGNSTENGAIKLITVAEKMSKSRGNVVDPMSIINNYGADALRVHLLFMGPFTSVSTWSTERISGAVRFLNKVWRLYNTPLGQSGRDSMPTQLPASTTRTTNTESTGPPIAKAYHELISKISRGIETASFNVAIAALMEFVNTINSHKEEFTMEIQTGLLKMLHPFAPHITEELWQRSLENAKELGNATTTWTGHALLGNENWPEVPSEVQRSSATTKVTVRINNKFRGIVEVPSGASKEDAIRAAYSNARILHCMNNMSNAGKQLMNIIYAPHKVLNFIYKEEPI